MSKLLLAGIELLLLLRALTALAPVLAQNMRSSRRQLWLLVLVGLLIISIAGGGSFAAITALKLMSFCLVLAFTYRSPREGLLWLAATLAASVTGNLADGEIFTKWTTVPFLLSAACWLTIRGNQDQRLTMLVLGIAAVFELGQASYVNSRGMAGTVVLISLLAVSGHAGYAFTVRRLAMWLPVLYPVILLLTLLSFVNEWNLIEPTASNIERSTLAFWSIVSMPDFVWFGPGADSFFALAQDDLGTAGRERDDDGIDPHSFLLSYWVGLGVLMMLVVYIGWRRFWKHRVLLPPGSSLSARLLLGTFAVNAIINFTLSAPDTYLRLIVAMSAALAGAGHKVLACRALEHREE